MLAISKIVVALYATVVCFLPVGLVVFLFAFQRDQAAFLSRAAHLGLVLAAFAIVEIGSKARLGALRVGRGVSLVWVAACTMLGQAFGWWLEPSPGASALACGFVGGLFASLVWSLEPATESGTAALSSARFGSRTARFGITILLAITLVCVGRATGVLGRL